MRSTLALIDAALWAGVILPERLPSLATALLAEDADTPALRLLAGLDMSLYDPRDAHDLFRRLMAECSVQPLSSEERVEAVAHVVATAHQDGRLATGAMLGRFHQLAMTADYPDHHVVMYLYGLVDEWQGGWGRTRAEIEADADEMTRSLAVRHPPPPPFLVRAIGGEGSVG